MEAITIKAFVFRCTVVRQFTTYWVGLESVPISFSSGIAPTPATTITTIPTEASTPGTPPTEASTPGTPPTEASTPGTPPTEAPTPGTQPSEPTHTDPVTPSMSTPTREETDGEEEFSFIIAGVVLGVAVLFGLVGLGVWLRR